MKGLNVKQPSLRDVATALQEATDALEAIVLDVAARFYHRATGNTLDLGDLQVEADLAAVEGETSWDE